MRRPKEYSPSTIESRWQKEWTKQGLYQTSDSLGEAPNWFALTMFPYPSGDVHIGHWYAFAPADAHARFMRMEGFNVMEPQGFDAFGLPAENAAIRSRIHPRLWTLRNIDNMRRQFRSMGNAYDWSREVVTCKPEYYKWNQYFFLKFFEAGLAYRASESANWCPNCNTTLANEQVKDGSCERCGSTVQKRVMPQWFFKITDYSDELLEMDDIEWPKKIKTMQRNWIGRSEGVTIRFEIEGMPGEEIETFTTRIDTVGGVTFIVLAPEHPLVEKITTSERKPEVMDYVDKASGAGEIERTAADRKREGVFTGGYGFNPFNGERVPVFVADYVLMTYGTGAVMGVPAHDDRDFEFAQTYGLDIRVVVAPPDWDGQPLKAAYLDEGTLVDSGKFNGMSSSDALRHIAEFAETEKWGRKTVTYHLRDWLISRQRYWGTPIPIVYCPDCGTVPVPYEHLPVLLPDQAEFLPSGESPLKLDKEFVNVPCPRCGKPAERETDTMDTFVDSAWYHLRYTSPDEEGAPFDLERLQHWSPVHQYMGGAEHAVMHLLYARFFTKALRDLGLLKFGEPYARLFNQGMLIKSGKKISKRSNPLNPEPIVSKYGADTMRCYLMFLGPWDQGGDWSDSGIKGPARWLNRVWELALNPPDFAKNAPTSDEQENALKRLCHSTTKQIVEDMRRFKFNTSIAKLMDMTNNLAKIREDNLVSQVSWDEAIDRLLLHLAPVAPHVAEELWHRRGGVVSIHLQRTPEWDEGLATEETDAIAVQVNGKVRDVIELPVGVSQDEALEAALASEGATRHVAGKEITRKIYVPRRMVSIVTR